MGDKTNGRRMDGQHTDVRGASPNGAASQGRFFTPSEIAELGGNVVESIDRLMDKAMDGVLFADGKDKSWADREKDRRENQGDQGGNKSGYGRNRGRWLPEEEKQRQKEQEKGKGWGLDRDGGCDL